MLLYPINLTTALRPLLFPDESLLFVQDAVGLYQGSAKLPAYQNGKAYLTSHRACYIDNERPRDHAIAIELKDVDHVELNTGFLKSSPKVTLYPKAAKHFALPLDSRDGRGSPVNSVPALTTSRQPAPNATWICPICSFSNTIPTNFDPRLANENTPLPPCHSCGIPPPYLHLLKAAIAGLSNRQPKLSTQTPTTFEAGPLETIKCAQCTFVNDASLNSCEICDATLHSNPPSGSDSPLPSRVDSPDVSQEGQLSLLEPLSSTKFSFRSGGEKVFFERLKEALAQKKWLVTDAPPPPSSTFSESDFSLNQYQRSIGITGLERRGLDVRRTNERVISTAFEDLAALVASAKEIIALAEKIPSQVRHDAGSDPSTQEANALLSQLNLSTTKEMLGIGGNSAASGTPLYISELSRQIVEFLTDDSSGVGVLRSAGGIISLVDLWMIFNRARGGLEPISPSDFAEAAQLFEKLSLPVRLREFKSGLLVIQGSDRTDEKTVQAIMNWLDNMKLAPPEKEVPWAWNVWGRGVTAMEAAEHFRWSVGVAAEELEMAEERGALCREVNIEGLRFWENWMLAEARTLDILSSSIDQSEDVNSTKALFGTK